METLELWYAVESFCYRIAVDLAMGDVLYRFTRPFVRRVSTARRAGIAYFAAMRVLDYMPLMIGNFLAYFLGVFAAFLFWRSGNTAAGRSFLPSPSFLCAGWRGIW